MANNWRLTIDHLEVTRGPRSGVEGMENEVKSEMTQTEYDQCAACGHVRVRHGAVENTAEGIGARDDCAIEQCTCPGFNDPDPTMRQTCPSRMGQMGPWERKENLDFWETHRWGPYYSAGTMKWPDGFAKPRTCSFCGSVHPEDAIKLLEAGWEAEHAKSYKRYLNPPGSQAHTEAVISRIRERNDTFIEPQHVSPVPPAKLYTWHFTNDELIARFNAALAIHSGEGSCAR